MKIFEFLKTAFNKVSSILIIGGCLFVVYDAIQYQKKASAREDARCKQLKEIAREMHFWKDDPEAMEFYAKGLDEIADAPSDYRWHFGESIKK